jgi:hypothetical protein
LLGSLKGIFHFPRFCSKFFQRIFELPEEAKKTLNKTAGDRIFQLRGRKVLLPHWKVTIQRENAAISSNHALNRGPDCS